MVNIFRKLASWINRIVTFFSRRKKYEKIKERALFREKEPSIKKTVTIPQSTDEGQENVTVKSVEEKVIEQEEIKESAKRIKEVKERDKPEKQVKERYEVLTKRTVKEAKEQKAKAEEEKIREKKMKKPRKKKSPTEQREELKKSSPKKTKSSTAKEKQVVDLGKTKKKTFKTRFPVRDSIPKTSDYSEKPSLLSQRVLSPYVEINFDEAKVFLVLPKQVLNLKEIENSLQELKYDLEINGKKEKVLAKVSIDERTVEIEEKKVEIKEPLKNFTVIFPKEINERSYRYKHKDYAFYVFISSGNFGKLYYLFDENGNINPLPKRDVWLLLNENFELSLEPEIIEERWIWENYQPLRIDLKNINELIVRSIRTDQEEKIPCENTFSIEGEELVEDDFKKQTPLFTGKTIKIRSPKVNPSGWAVWIQNKQAGYRITSENWTGAEELELELPDDLPCEYGEFQIDICERGENVPVETLFFRYVPFLQLEYPKEPIIPNPPHGHRAESIKVVLGSNFQEWELKTNENVEFIENGYQIELPPEQDILHFSITKRNKPETEVRFQITIPRVKWKISKQETWNDKPLQIKRDELIPGSELYLIVCTNSMGGKYDLLAILKSNDQRLQEGELSKKGMSYFLFLNEFRDTILNNSGKLTLTVGIDNKLWFDAIYFPPDINRLKKILNLLKSVGYQDIPDFDTTLEQEYKKAESIIHEKLNNLREVCEYIVRESKCVICRDLLKEAQEDFNQNNLMGVINKYSRIINNFRDKMYEMLKSLYDVLEELQKDNEFIEEFSEKHLKDDMEKMREIYSMQLLQKRDIENFYESRNKVAESINIIKYQLNEFWVSFVSDIKTPGDIKYLVKKWRYFKERFGNLGNIDKDFDEKYVFEPLRENDEIRRTILKFFIPKSLNEINLDYRLGFMDFLSQKDKEYAKRDANRFFDKLIKLKKEIQNELEVNENGDGPS